MDLIGRFASLDDFKTEFDSYFPSAGKYASCFKFRGQKELNWKLQSTLERKKPHASYSLQHYLEICARAHARLAEKLLLGRTFPTDALKAKDWDNLIVMGAESFNDLLYIILDLRHHHFPSPVLDWTSCADVAAFFAHENSEGASDIAIFVHRKNGLHSTFQGEPSIQEIAPDIGFHFRQDNQKAIHTICGTFSDDELIFCPYESVLSEQTNSKDEVKKFCLSGHHRETVLSQFRWPEVTRETIYGNRDCGPSEKDRLCREIANELFC